MHEVMKLNPKSQLICCPRGPGMTQGSPALGGRNPQGVNEGSVQPQRYTKRKELLNCEQNEENKPKPAIFHKALACWKEAANRIRP